MNATLLVNILPVDLTTARVNVNLHELEETLTLPCVPNDPEEQNHRHSQHDLKETGSICVAAGWWADGGVPLSSEDQQAEREAGICTVDTEDGLVGDLVDGVALGFPCGTETDVCL